MKNKNDDNEMVTVGFLREILDDFATRIETRIENNVVARISAKIDEKIGTAIGDLAIMVEKGFQRTTKQMNSRFEQVEKRFEQIDRKFERIDIQFSKVFSEFKEVHKEIDVNKLKTQSDAAGLDFRVGKLEKKVSP